MIKHLQKIYTFVNDPLLWEPYTDKLSTFVVQKIPLPITLKVFPYFIRLVTKLAPSTTREVVPYLQNHFQIDSKAAQVKARDIAVAYQMVSTLNFLIAQIKTPEEADSFIKENIRIEGLAVLENALKTYPNRPIMIAGFHMSILSLMVATLRDIIDEERKVVLTMYKNAPGVHWEKNLGIAKTARKKIDMIDIENRIALKNLLRMFKEDAPVFWITSDLHSGYGETVSCQFLGETFHFASGGMKIAMSQKAKVIVAYLTGIPFKGPLTAHFVDPEIDPDLPVTAEGIQANQQKVITVLEQSLKQYPEFWHGWWVLDEYKKAG